MGLEHYKLPASLERLIASGVWPTSTNFQESKPLLGKEAANKLSPNDDRIVLMPPPFHTIADEVRGGDVFWTVEITNPTEIDYDRALIIADFGIGSDSPIILYYRTSDVPVVMYLRWSGNGESVRHRWVETHLSFDDFAFEVGLDRMQA